MVAWVSGRYKLARHIADEIGMGMGNAPAINPAMMNGQGMGGMMGMGGMGMGMMNPMMGGMMRQSLWL